MAKLKIDLKKKSSKKVFSKKEIKSSLYHGRGFLGIIVIFAGVSLYAMVSFFSSTNKFIDRYYVDVTGTEGSVSIAPEKPAEKIFNDVDENYQHFTAIQALYHQGIVSGYGDGSFKPEKTVNRAELLTMLTNAVDADFAGKKLDGCFSDVKSEWYSVFVCYAKDSDWVKGFEDGSYKPAQAVNKAQALKIIFKAFNYPICDSVKEPPYKDVTVDSWYAPYACKAKEKGILADNNFFSPDYNITRAEIVQVIYNVMKDMQKI